MNAELFAHQALDDARRIRKGRGLNVQALEKARKLFLPLQHQAKEALQNARKLGEGRRLLVKKGHGLSGVRQGIVELVGQELFVFEQLVKALAREKKGRKRQRVDRDDFLAQYRAQIGHVKGHDVVPAHILGPLAELPEGRGVGRVKEPSVRAAGPEVDDAVGFGRHFGVDKHDGIFVDRARQLHGTGV